MAIQIKTSVKHFVIYEIEHEKHLREFDDFNTMMRWTCREIAFSDCSDVIIHKIIGNSQEIHYMGWRPQMQMTFYAGEDKHNIVWDNYYPEYDH